MAPKIDTLWFEIEVKAGKATKMNITAFNTSLKQMKTASDLAAKGVRSAATAAKAVGSAARTAGSAVKKTAMSVSDLAVKAEKAAANERRLAAAAKAAAAALNTQAAAATKSAVSTAAAGTSAKGAAVGMAATATASKAAAGGMNTIAASAGRLIALFGGFIILRGIVKGMVDFETKIAEISTIAEEGTDQVERLQKAMLAMSRSRPHTAVELAAGA